MPASYDFDIDLPATTLVTGTAIAFFEEADPGQFVRLIDDPVFLSLQRQIRSLKAKIRKARREGNSALVKKLGKKLKRTTARFRRV